MFVTVIFIIMGILFSLFVVIFLIEAIYHDYQSSLFHKELKSGDMVTFRGEHFFVYKSNPESGKAWVYNLFYEPMLIDKEDIYPLNPYKTLVFHLIKRSN